MDIEKLLDEKEKIKKDLSTLKDKLIEEENEDMELIWKDQIDSKEIILGEIMDKIFKIQESKKNKFLNNISNKRNKNSLNTNLFKIAKKDAENILFSAIAAPPTDICNLFSTNDNIIKYIQGANVRSNKICYKWYHDVTKRDDNIIPPSPGIEIPRKTMSDGRTRPIYFLAERFYRDEQFIKRCTDYYKQFNINFSIKTDKGNKKKFWIYLNLNPDCLIHF